MSEFRLADSQSSVTAGGIEFDQRDVRALTEYMTVVPLGSDLYSVTTESGSEYRVDARAGRCTCPDYLYRNVRCKHQQRVAFATGERPIPASVDAHEIDANLGAHVDGTPHVAVADGGVAGDSSGTVEARGDRPADCDCGEWNARHDLCCWPCYREGFETPNPTAPTADG